MFFPDALTSATLLHGVATIQALHGVTRPPRRDSYALNKTRPQPGDGVSAFLCNFLDDHGVKPVKVLKKAGLRHETPADWHSGDAVHALYEASPRFMPQTLHTDSEAASDNDQRRSRLLQGVTDTFPCGQQMCKYGYKRTAGCTLCQ
jgi:hypothetical protein